MQYFRPGGVTAYELLLRVIEVTELLPLDVEDKCVDRAVTATKKMKLILKMPVHGHLDRGSADPDSVAAKEGCHEAKQQPSISPKLHNAAGTRIVLWHRPEKERACLISCASVSSRNATTSG